MRICFLSEQGVRRHRSGVEEALGAWLRLWGVAACTLRVEVVGAEEQVLSQARWHHGAQGVDRYVGLYLPPEELASALLADGSVGRQGRLLRRVGEQAGESLLRHLLGQNRSALDELPAAALKPRHGHALLKVSMGHFAFYVVSAPGRYAASPDQRFDPARSELGAALAQMRVGLSAQMRLGAMPIDEFMSLGPGDVLLIEGSETPRTRLSLDGRGLADGCLEIERGGTMHVRTRQLLTGEMGTT
ncbi:hypothetical protein QE438_003183 [Pseudoxanthomonas sp. SORGH_AS 997]|uniref:Flagellar motor switch protein FliN-like C-terminal domain-containing protein n=1 Tax=Pseudoxanthomonas winnipegensis TaxID=2480810 RepID=A0AAW8GI57_9GAMM|nr:hypothetical protein [Pseudoxanthomonas winnipegensis]MDQ1133885.1 hypothetical protein [Pseudoxanthomonas winnipegensis]MDR6139879.1 hypothetical protein [Pseudoxanthomonas sp. SORGH_AS_0997]